MDVTYVPEEQFRRISEGEGEGDGAPGLREMVRRSREAVYTEVAERKAQFGEPDGPSDTTLRTKRNRVIVETERLAGDGEALRAALARLESEGETPIYDALMREREVED